MMHEECSISHKICVSDRASKTPTKIKRVERDNCRRQAKKNEEIFSTKKKWVFVSRADLIILRKIFFSSYSREFFKYTGIKELKKIISKARRKMLLINNHAINSSSSRLTREYHLRLSTPPSGSSHFCER